MEQVEISEVVEYIYDIGVVYKFFGFIEMNSG